LSPFPVFAKALLARFSNGAPVPSTYHGQAARGNERRTLPRTYGLPSP